ncbi:ABC-three component system protein [Metabacillus fastidiosus]|uniref:ABC-three component system protein n=1 Tax=Metabacillus fastidiosus TaxID=1458 RepID=UPI003D2752F2
MNRTSYFNYIEEKLQLLGLRIAKRGKLNLLELNIHSETFFADLLNILFSYELVNLNVYKQNVEGIDLVDANNKVIAQVSSTCTKQKIESSLKKKIFLKYTNHRFKFISIAKDADNLRNTNFVNPHGALFTPADDIIDINTILKVILNMSIDKQKELYDFIKKELGTEINIIGVDTNLATIINILADEDLASNIVPPQINHFEIDKKIEFNDLLSVKDTIDDYKIYYHKLDEKYKEFDREGANKSFSVFQIIRKQYTFLQNKVGNPHDLFFNIVNNIIDIIEKSKNYKKIPYEELEMCVEILVVDAFIRCKIFKNPEGYNYVITR